jgi:hypothetical protein
MIENPPPTGIAVPAKKSEVVQPRIAAIPAKSADTPDRPRGSLGIIGTVAQPLSAYRNCENVVADVQRCPEIVQEGAV